MLGLKLNHDSKGAPGIYLSWSENTTSAGVLIEYILDEIMNALTRS